MKYLLLSIFVAVIVAAAVGVAGKRYRGRPEPSVTGDLVAPGNGVMFVTVHGMFRTRAESMAAVESLLADHGAVYGINYDSSAWANARPEAVAVAAAATVGRAWLEHGRPQLVLVGYSVGALLLRRAFLHAYNEGEPWAAAVTRIVLLAGMNRGWDLTGHKPADMKWWCHAWYSMAVAGARLTGVGRFLLDMEAGAPFVANLRLDWMNAERQAYAAGSFPEVVQLLGDIDDLVSDADNRDLATGGPERFAWLRVRGTGHSSIIDMGRPVAAAVNGEKGTFDVEQELRAYRGQKLILAATAPFEEVRAENEELPPAVDPAVTDLVFVIHGIRDLGEWSALFETAIQRRFAAVRGDLAASRGQSAATAENSKVAIESSRYGYFGMGPFVLKLRRQQYVRWLMDEYTEARAKYPGVVGIHFVGHSNGTYLLAEALETYRSMRVDNVVFAGSVVPQRYDWCARFASGQVAQVRNYVAADDKVVALLPSLFEMRIASWMGNDIGSAGFNGFSQASPLPDGVQQRCPTPPADAALMNVGYVTGGHSAHVRTIDSMANFLIAPVGAIVPPLPALSRGQWQWLKGLADYGGPVLVWFVILAGVAGGGAAVVSAAREWLWLALGLYLLLLVALLREI